MAHLLHAREGAVVEVARIAVGLRAAAGERHAVVLAATHHDEVEEHGAFALEAGERLVVLREEGFETRGEKIERTVEVRLDVHRKERADSIRGRPFRRASLRDGRRRHLPSRRSSIDDENERDHHAR